MTTETPNTEPKAEPKAERKRRNQSYIVEELVPSVSWLDIENELPDRGMVPPEGAKPTPENSGTEKITAKHARDTLEGYLVDAWVPVRDWENEGDVIMFDDLAACDRWIKNHGEDGSTYRPARVADAVEVTTRTETVRELKAL